MTTTTRTDIHSPSNFDPAEYNYVGSFDAWRDYRLNDVQLAEEVRLRSFLDDHGFEGGNWQNKGQCDHCGARFRYVQVWEHEPTNVYLAIGETCGEGRFDLDSRASFDRQALVGRAAAARVAAKRDAQIATTLEANEGLELALKCDHEIVQDIARRFYETGNISDRQIAFVWRLVQQTAERKAKRAAEDDRKIPAPTGRVQFEGVVVSRKFHDTDFGGAFKLTVKCETPEGLYLVWVSEPSKLVTERGDIVRMTATLTRSDRDESFAFGKRPSKAEKIGRNEEVAAASSLD